VNLILKKISKIGATRCQILRLTCTKIDFGWGSAGGAYSAPPDPLAVFKEGKGEERREREGKGKGKGRGRGREGTTPLEGRSV